MPAILDIWYPGTQGGAAVANLLFGDVSPGGKLPFTWPRTVGQVPMIYTHTRSHEPENQGRRYWDEQSTPLFPFGHGLGYGALRVRRPHRRPRSIAAGETVTVSVDVTNAGAARRPTRSSSSTSTSGTAPRPARSASSRASSGSRSPPGESRTVRFTLGPDELRYWNAAAATGCSTPRRSTSGSAATRPRDARHDVRDSYLRDIQSTPDWCCQRHVSDVACAGIWR